MTANGTTPLHDLAADYRDAVYAALADLPGEEIADALEEVETKLLDVVAELTDGGTEVSAAALRERLGTPREYADEFRTAASYPPGHPPGRPGGRTAGGRPGGLRQLGRSVPERAVLPVPVSVSVWLRVTR